MLALERPAGDDELQRALDFFRGAGAVAMREVET